jgi:2-C-methyl-D-erythritol 2,4-cyclodiphosphate synthase
VDIRVGHGLDVHAFSEGRALIVGGMRLEHPRGLAGHSDGDPVIHAVIDALLGAAAMPDIGSRFPSNDPRYAGVDSLILLDDVVLDLTAQGWIVGNVDVTIVAQEPRFAGAIVGMRANLAAHLQTELNRVNVKATTTDHLGALGRAEGVGAEAVVLIQRKGEPG